MKRFLMICLATAGLTTAATAARAEAFYVWNKNSVAIWVTFYSGWKDQMATRCVLPDQVSTPVSFSDKYSWLGAGYVRYEYKPGRDCGGKTVRDTGQGSGYSTTGKSDINITAPVYYRNSTRNPDGSITLDPVITTTPKTYN